jgi:hypothetical protein
MSVDDARIIYNALELQIINLVFARGDMGDDVFLPLTERITYLQALKTRLRLEFLL